RHYHGHLSGVHSLSLHPTPDILATAGREMSQSDPQVITGSMGTTVRQIF
ncbi:hypothetical protein JOM56_012840, partial [Amanita muscaria]